MLVLYNLDKVLSQLLHKSMSGDTGTSNTVYRLSDTLFFSLLYTFGTRCIYSVINSQSSVDCGVNNLNLRMNFIKYI